MALGVLAHRFERFDVAEDAVQEALLAASDQWPREGVPENPRTWLIRVGHRRMIDLVRSETSRHRRELDVGAEEFQAPAGRATTTDDSLTLLLLCCHPVLSDASRVALTLRAVGGLTTREIAHALGATEPTTATRISRAKQTLARDGIRFTPPAREDLPERLRGVRTVLYLVYNEGYTASVGDSLGRIDLAHEAIRLARLLHEASPEDAESTGLLALMLLTEARREARSGATDELVPMAHQDRSRWDASLIVEGQDLIDGVWARMQPGPYQLQAAIASLHVEPDDPGDTDWTQIAGLYLALERHVPTGPVRLSRVVAVAHAFGAKQGLALLERIEREHRLSKDRLTAQRTLAVRAHLLEMVGDSTAAASRYREAAGLTNNAVEQEHLLSKADEIQPMN